MKKPSESKDKTWIRNPYTPVLTESLTLRLPHAVIASFCANGQRNRAWLGQTVGIGVACGID